MSWTRSLTLGPLERRVFLVALASLIPVAILTGTFIVSNARDQESRLYRATDNTVLTVLKAIDAELKNSISALDALAVSPRLARGDFQRLQEEALDLLERRPSWLSIIVSDQHAQLMSANRSGSANLGVDFPPATVAEAFATEGPVIGGIVHVPSQNTHGFTVQVPYSTDGQVRHVLTAVVLPDSLVELLGLADVAHDGVISVLDRDNRIVTRSRSHGRYVGKAPSDELVPLLRRGGTSGQGITHSLEGEPVYAVYRRSDYSGWTVAMGVPQEAIEGPLRRSYLMLGGSIGASILLGLAMALFVGWTIVRPIRELEGNAARVGRGEAPGMAATRLPELHRVSVALAEAHAERHASFQREHDARLAAEKASRAKDEFLAMLGHELRNPLAAITNASRLINHRRASLDDTTELAVGIIGRQARHLARLTDDLLDAGRVILGKISLTRSPVDLAQTVRTTMEELQGTGRLSSHDLQIELEPAWIFADATRIDQIVCNLLINAIKYTPAGGSIRVTTRRVEGWAILTVSDTGIGLESELVARVFDLFAQGERALDRSQGGLGIGLTLVQRLAELHGGSAEARSEGTDKGAEFTVRLPAAEAPAEIAHHPTEAKPVRCHVGLIEDNEDARSSFAMLLRSDGHEVHEAADGPAGVELLADPRIRIAFIDIGLPGMSGFEVAKAVRAARGADIRLVAMSGYGADQDLGHGRRSGFDAYIVKPAQFDRVQAELALLAEGSAASAETHTAPCTG